MTDKSIIPAAIAIQKLAQGDTIENSRIKEEINLYDSLGHEILQPITIIDCNIENLQALAMTFESEVRFVNTYFGNLDFRFSYFKKGLVLDNCTFQNALSFEAGGHNERKIEIKNCKFFGLVDFFDTWFQDEVCIIGNEFAQGSTLLGNRNTGYAVSFDKEPIILNNIGRLDLNDEEITKV